MTTPAHDPAAQHAPAQGATTQGATVAPALEVRGIAKRFGGLLALRDVSFSVRSGEVMGLIGPNGAGKSTLFEIVSGNIAPSSGRVLYFGEDCTALPVHRRRRAGLCRTFQKVRLFDTLTVRENIAVAARQSLPAGADWAAEVASVLERMRLGKQADRLPSQITLADRKKVEIGRAIAGNCRVLLLDESLSGLTHDEAEELIVEIMALNRASGITVVVAGDAVASRNPVHVPMALTALRDLGALVVPTESIIMRLQRQAGTGHFKALSQLIR